MTFTETPLAGLWIVDADVFRDERGAFVRAWMPRELEARGLSGEIAYACQSFNEARGTIRGLHYQAEPAAELKFVRATRGGVFDVAVDLRPGSPTFKRWFGVELTADNWRALYIPAGFAHGFQTLTDASEVLYFISTPYSPAHQRGVRWNDPAFNIAWPLGAPAMINDRDAGYPDFTG